MTSCARTGTILVAVLKTVSYKRSGRLWGLCRNKCIPVAPATSCPVGTGHLRHLNPQHRYPQTLPQITRQKETLETPLRASDASLLCLLRAHTTHVLQEAASTSTACHTLLCVTFLHLLPVPRLPSSLTAVPRWKVLLQATHTCDQPQSVCPPCILILSPHCPETSVRLTRQSCS